MALSDAFAAVDPNGVSLETAFKGWKTFNSLPASDLEVAVLRFLREAHPDLHATRAKPSDVNLIAYAEAGHAKLQVCRGDNYDATRRFKSPETRLLGTAGKLADDVRFGRWHYEWKDDTFIVYQATQYDVYLREKKMLFVLSPHSTNTAAAADDGLHAATDRLLLAAGEWTQALHDEIYVFDDTQWTKDKLLFKAVQGSTWDDVIMHPDMKRSLMHDVQSFFDARPLYHRMRVPWKRGVILHGVPGNGKTISIKALINALAARPDPVPALYVKSLDACQGPKWSIQQIFKHARKMAPCLLVFEDLDSMVEDKTRSYFLNEVDGLESNEGILMIGSTNYLNRLDDAITKRPSRFDRKYHFKVPGDEEREAYCRYWAGKFEDAAAVGFCDELYRVVAQLTDGFSFAYLKELFVTSLLAMAREDSDEAGADGGAAHEAVSDNGSSSDGVVVEASSAAPEGDGEGKDAEAPPKVKRVMPEVEIPESLADNKLFCAILREAKTLWEQMDNSDEEADKKPKSCSTADPMSMAFMRAMAARDD